jgi:membrane dipeptidase
MKAKLIALFLKTYCILLLSVSSLAAFTIEGIVKDAVTHRNLIQSRVTVISELYGTRDTVYTDRGGKWIFDAPYSAIDDQAFVPTQFQVSQNYPNPFNPSTEIEFSVPTAGITEISVHNILGQELDTRRAFLTPGNYRVSWQSHGAAGVYFYTIRHNGQSQTRKMVQLDGGRQGGLSAIAGTQAIPIGNLSKASQLPLTLIFGQFGYWNDTLQVSINGGESFETYLETIHNRAVMVDLHNDILEKILDDTNYHFIPRHSYNHTDIPRLIEGGVDIQFFAIWISPSTYPENQFLKSQDALYLFNRELNLYPDYIQQARCANEALQIVNQQKIAAVLAVEGGHHIENDLSKLYSLYEAGMRYLTITWNNSTDWAVSAKDEYNGNRTGGLTDFGREVIRKLDSLGVIIDVSHTGIQTISDILEVTINPIVATHSGVRALRDHYRNLYDDQIQAIAASGGVIGIVFYPPFLAPYNVNVTIEHVIQHIDYIVNLVGIDYVAIGSDFDGIGTNTVYGLDDVSDMPELTMALLEHGYSRMDVKKILGKNFLRVFQQICGE